jgi:hypothetical protein
VRIWDIEEGDVLGEETMMMASVLKEFEESLVIVFGWVIRAKMVSSSVRQLSVRNSEIVVLGQDHSGTALVCWKY